MSDATKVSELSYSDRDWNVAHWFNDSLARLKNEGIELDGILHDQNAQQLVLNKFEKHHDSLLLRLAKLIRPNRLDEHVIWGVETANAYERGSGIDWMTGLPTMKAFESRLKDEMARIRRNEKNRFLVMCMDLNGFKGINYYGRDKGDEAVRLFADSLRDVTRDTDFISRRQAGGDEFFVLLELNDQDDVVETSVDYQRRLYKQVQEKMKTKDFPWDVVNKEGESLYLIDDVPRYAAMGVLLVDNSNVYTDATELIAQVESREKQDKNASGAQRE